MNLQEFAALKVGDKVENAMLGSHGEVTQVAAQGVRVVWGGAEPIAANQFLYTVQSTAWMHWGKSEGTRDAG